MATSGTQIRCADSQETLPRGCRLNNSDLFLITAGSLTPTGQSHRSFTQMAQQSLLCSALHKSGLHRLHRSQQAYLRAPTERLTELSTLNGFLAQSSKVLPQSHPKQHGHVCQGNTPLLVPVRVPIALINTMTKATRGGKGPFTHSSAEYPDCILVL